MAWTRLSKLSRFMGPCLIGAVRIPLHILKRSVNGDIYMDFRQATDGLCAKVDHDDVARALGVSLQTIRQARLQRGSNAHRSPPAGWRDAVIRLAEEKVAHYRRLIEKLEASDSSR